MGEKVEKKKITPVLLGMKVGANERFPIEQESSVQTAIQRQQRKHVRIGLKWSTEKTECGLELIVTRTA